MFRESRACPRMTPIAIVMYDGHFSVCLWANIEIYRRTAYKYGCSDPDLGIEFLV